MSGRLVLALAGLPGVGKTTLGSFAEEELGFKVFDGSTSIRQRASEDGVTLTDRASYNNFFRKTQIEHGKAWISDSILSQSGDVAQIGLRNKDDAKNILAIGGIVVALYCPPEICFERANKDDPKQKSNLAEFVAMIDEQESIDDYGSHTNWVMEHATVSIDASRPLTHTKTALSLLVDYYAGQQM